MKVGEIASIRHYSGKTWFKSIVLQVEKNMLVVKLIREFAVLNFLENDPVVLGYEENDEVFILSCVVTGIDPDCSYIKLKIESVMPLKEQREYERFPVSFYAKIRCEDSDKINIATIKNMSFDGLMINTNADLPLRKNIEVIIYPTFQEVKIDQDVDKTVISLKSDIVRKEAFARYFEYGLKITNIDAQNQNLIRLYLQSIKGMQAKFLKDLKNSP
ncbi:MAG TPA: PilZ domain-containing protein [Acetivibrio sp.]|uniref:PilZ domain-containing protein n=1 Tax=Acetivibrio sp. TaxID=1872092 RepID=UPI002BCD5ABE|nr:PilZ domain-containing protein [Acetivibrio sp.]HOM03686.1 PilZ domain-containing protein [Acetivibrio sp.]